MTGPGERSEMMSAPHDVPIRHSAPPLSTPTLDGSHQSPYSSNAREASRGSDVWAGAISRLQTQTQLNSSMLHQSQQKVGELEHSVRILHSDLNAIRQSLGDIHAELRSRGGKVEPRQHDPRDLEILVRQVEAATTKANEIDSIRMQVDLLRNTMKRMEEHGSPAVSGLRPGTSSTHRDVSFHDGQQQPPPPMSHFAPGPSLHPALPPMRTASMSSADSRPMSLSATHPSQHVPILEAQSRAGYHSSPYPTDLTTSMHPPSAATFRPLETLPPPSSLTGWRPADTMVPPANLPPPPPPPSSVRPQTIESGAGWAAVNAAQPPKRPLEEQRPSPYESPAMGSPKRPKLAPIMPRSNYGEETSYVPSSIVTDSNFASRSRAPSDGSQSQILPTPASANTPGHRFIISTQEADSQASWRPESDRMHHGHFHGHRGHGPHHHGHGHGHGHGRGRGRGVRGGRGRRGRGGTSHPPDVPELSTPEWEKPGWTGSQVSPNGFYDPIHHHHDGEAPEQRTRTASAASLATDREGEFPATPLAVQGPYDPFTAGHPDSSNAGQSSAGKKTRTKPFRNAEGVLIRKDGRPDMRSVSSANNLRKVHAKKEAERAEVEGRTPTSARSLAPAHSNPMSEDENMSQSPGSPPDADEGDEHDQDTEQRHEELMSKIYPHRTDSTGQSAAERFFPRDNHDQPAEGEQRDADPGPEDNADEIEVKKRDSSQLTDVVMREMSEAQAEDADYN